MQRIKTNVYSLGGKKLKEITLPEIFNAELHPELIKRAVLSIQSARIQPKGVKPQAGRSRVVEYRASRSLPASERTINVGRARLPRLKNRRGLLLGRVSGVPQAVSGPKAHQPKKEQRRKEKINKKEKRAALRSAIAACVIKELVKKRHVFNETLPLPIVFEDKFADLNKTKEVVKALKTLDLTQDISKAKEKKKIRAGKGKRRGRKRKRKKSLLIVVGKSTPIYRAARNLEGVEVRVAKNLNAELLAPGCIPGRLTVWTESAIKAIGEEK